jgi:hypothetical protein
MHSLKKGKFFLGKNGKYPETKTDFTNFTAYLQHWKIGS